MSDGERDLVRWLIRRGKPQPHVRVGIGDDMAMLDVGAGGVLVTCDMLLDGVHFDTGKHTLAQIGRKAANCSLSDCAAMAVRPVGAVVSLALPRGFGLEKTQELLEAIAAACEKFECPLVGGDTTSWDNPLAIDATILATPYEDIRPVRRSGARPGDRLFVTGLLGGSILGHHLEFAPLLPHAALLASLLEDRLHAMMDVSDGLALDLGRMCEASGVGAILDEAKVLSVASAAAKKLAAQTGRSVLDHVLGDGEDFELLYAADSDEKELEALCDTEIGKVVAGAGLQMRGRFGKLRPIEPTGYQHL